MMLFFFFKQKTAYDMRISDWSSDVCSSDLFREVRSGRIVGRIARRGGAAAAVGREPDIDRHGGCRRHGSDRIVERGLDRPRLRSEERRVGTSVSVRVVLGGRRIIKKKRRTQQI